jgi:hypothetical protein
MDEVKITKPSLSQQLQPESDNVRHLSNKPPNSKSFIETPDRTMSGRAGQCPDFESWPND